MPIIGQLSISRAAFWQLKEVLDPLEKYPLEGCKQNPSSVLIKFIGRGIK